MEGHLVSGRKRLAGVLAGLALLSIVGAIGVGGSIPEASAADKNCSDFPNQAAAQDYFEDHQPGDPAGLDGDGDGVACESNPCPCSSGGGGGEPTPPSGGGSKGYRVVSVTDGDTIKVTRRGKESDVRIIGIDTPEVFFGAECGGAQASASMKQLLAPGDRVKLIRDRSQDAIDAYDRLLRYVEIGGRDVGRKQIRRGWAQVYVFERPFERVRSYRRQRDSAKKRGRGAWDRCDGDFHQPL